MSSASFTFTNTIPAANNSPSNDQPLMLVNNQSTASLLAIDHIGFNAAFGGNHLQMHLPSYAITPTVVSSAATEGSLIYTGAGTADAAHAQCFFKIDNSGLTFLLSSIRAFALVNNAGAIVASQSWNIASVTKLGVGDFRITMTTNAVTSANYLVQLTSRQAGGNFVVGNTSSLNLGNFECLFANLGGAPADPNLFFVLVMQL